MSDNFDRAGLALAVFAFFGTALLAWGAFATTQGVRSDVDSWLGGAALILGGSALIAAAAGIARFKGR